MADFGPISGGGMGVEREVKGQRSRGKVHPGSLLNIKYAEEVLKGFRRSWVSMPRAKVSCHVGLVKIDKLKIK